MDMSKLIEYVFILGIPSAVTALLFRRMERRMDAREQDRIKYELLSLRGTGAAIALGEACAVALKNGRANGETEAALEYARKIKHEQKDFLQEKAIQHVGGI